ncbi:MAG: antitoxin Xre/MbcA/ParS toxin-binding domain-containing protein [Actinomycetota bacterium]
MPQNKTSVKKTAAARRRSAARSKARTVSASDLAVVLPGGAVGVMQAKAAHVVDRLGGVTKTARALGVARSQPGRWVKGTEAPSPESARRLMDIDYVLGRLEQIFVPEVAQVWLVSPNAFLGGARPFDVLQREGPAEVIAAIDAAAAGSYP